MISVVIPLYNAGKYICDAVDSALRQEVPLEIIVIDDCSTDDSVSILSKHIGELYGSELTVKEDGDICCKVNGNSITIHHMEANSGVAASRNKGVSMARGEYIAFLDADDIWADGKLAAQLRVMEKTGALLCNTGRQFMDAAGNIKEHIVGTPEQITLKTLEKSNYINCSSVMVRRDYMLKYPMEHSEAHEDYLTWLRMLKDMDNTDFCGCRYFVGIDEPLIYYRVSSAGKSGSKLKSALMTYKTYRLSGYGLFKTMRMMVGYTLNGLKKWA